MGPHPPITLPWLLLYSCGVLGAFESRWPPLRYVTIMVGHPKGGLKKGGLLLLGSAGVCENYNGAWGEIGGINNRTHTADTNCYTASVCGRVLYIDSALLMIYNCNCSPEMAEPNHNQAGEICI